MSQLSTIYDHYLSSTGVCIDSRKVEKNNIFFAIRGENFDGNAYAAAAMKKGACIAIIDNKDYYDGQRYILVEDSLASLQEIAKIHREQHQIPLIGLTGTNGKTTTKELLARVLSKKYRVLATAGNLNNHLGVPLTLLGIQEGDEIAVVEMGANHIGEIALLSNLAQPNKGLITNIGRAHLEGFGSYEGVIKAKTELYNYLNASGGQAFVNSDNDLLMEQASGLNKVTYGKSLDADIIGRITKNIPFLEIEWNNEKIGTRLYGSYNFENIMAAICIGKHFGVDKDDIVEAISSYLPDNSRSQVIEKGSNTIFLDAYNANPSSMQASISNFLQQTSENKAIILGDMLELGSESYAEHQKILEIVKGQFSRIILVGPEFIKVAPSYNIDAFENTEAAAIHLRERPLKHTHILVKGSRGIALEKLLEYL